ncbi:hypothetical protein SGL43_02873 [Streptomyces globisporus]|uniref:Uncharacterized protein n=1 Tax=Streptomyces globisporus TaxID=1908 RepID=A0ABN8UZU5_STRGL|nr:hypothetical protein SGL43_02873 [Streptomyces globisporus]
MVSAHGDHRRGRRRRDGPWSGDGPVMDVVTRCPYSRRFLRSARAAATPWLMSTGDAGG